MGLQVQGIKMVKTKTENGVLDVKGLMTLKKTDLLP